MPKKPGKTKSKEWSNVDEASWESFPASDPPAISPTTTHKTIKPKINRKK